MSDMRSQLARVSPEQLAFSNFRSYIALQNPNYRFSKHNLVLADVLQRVESGEIRRLIVDMPPRHGKTMQIGEYFPAWFTGRNPTFQSVYSTYAFERAGDVGRKVRNQMIDSIYQRVFPESPISSDSRGINRLSTTKGGNFFAVGVGGIITGRGAHLLIVDDPHKNRQDVESETRRNQVISWFRGVAYTRLMPDVPDTEETILGRIIVVMTRWHYSDLVGFILKEFKHEPWHLLKMPAICDSDDDVLGRKPGEALWPSHYPIEVLENIRETVGTVEWNAQYQQTPMDAKGGMVKLEWFSRYDWEPWAGIEFVLKFKPTEIIQTDQIPYGITRIVISADTAYKEKQLNDPSAFTIWGVTRDNRFFLLNTVNERMVYPTLKKTAAMLWEKYSRVKTNLPVIMLIEDKGSGTSLIQEFQAAGKIPVVAIPAVVSKQIRMSTASPKIEAGNVHLPKKSPWLVPYETQMIRFPLWKEDDLVDSTSQFLNWAGSPIYVPRGIRYYK